MFLKKTARSIMGWTKKSDSDGQFTIANAMALTLDHYAFSRQKKAISAPAKLAEEHQRLLLEVASRGFAAIENFLSQSDCDRLGDSLAQQLAENPDLLHPGTQYDLRLHGVERVDAAFLAFSQNPLLEQLATAYMKRPTRTAFTLGASLRAVEGNPGSGGGWHRDSLTRQFKTMLYLTDVTLDSGPFQILERSHRLLQAIRDNRAARLPYGQVRITQDQVNKILESSTRERLHTLHYPAGALLIFDSSSIHRGAPIKTGTRLALTNYFYPESQINFDLYRHFYPVAGHLQ